MHHPTIRSACILIEDPIRHSPEIMEANYKDFLFCQEVEAADRLFDLQALLLLASLNIPHADRLVVAAADEALAYGTDKVNRLYGIQRPNPDRPLSRSVVQKLVCP